MTQTKKRESKISSIWKLSFSFKFFWCVFHSKVKLCCLEKWLKEIWYEQQCISDFQIICLHWLCENNGTQQNPLFYNMRISWNKHVHSHYIIHLYTQPREMIFNKPKARMENFTFSLLEYFETIVRKLILK